MSVELLNTQTSLLEGTLLGGGGSGIWSYENFLSEDECKELIKFFNVNNIQQLLIH